MRTPQLQSSVLPQRCFESQHLCRSVWQQEVRFVHSTATLDGVWPRMWWRTRTENNRTLALETRYYFNSRMNQWFITYLAVITVFWVLLSLRVSATRWVNDSEAQTLRHTNTATQIMTKNKSTNERESWWLTCISFNLSLGQIWEYIPLWQRK